MWEILGLKFIMLLSILGVILGLIYAGMVIGRGEPVQEEHGFLYFLVNAVVSFIKFYILWKILKILIVCKVN